ncbi:MAG TPA: proton-conducting transporter membrane subunit [Rhizomicrobium sp.]|nr:proton-conducting transporter membrane subunit [Rhizomicrobium sp.]
MTSGILLYILVVAPLAAASFSLVSRNARVAEFSNFAASGIVLACAVPLPFMAAAGSRVFLDGYIALDGLGAWVVLCTAIVYFLASFFAIGYMRMLDEDERLPQFYALFAIFALTTLFAPVVNNAGLYWIAIELTTLVSTFLVAFERTAESMEAAWKYIMIVSAGISLALLGTVLFYWAGTFVLGPTYSLTWGALQAAAPRMNPSLVLLAFLLCLVGYGTKVGLAPMHTWLPDAHSESPAPVSAMLSGALLNAAMVGIARFLSITNAANLPTIPHLVVVIFGLGSLALGALFIVRQEGIKRLMAYSSIEHMGVIALGFGFGGIFGIAGALYHMLNHSLNKSLMFFGAGCAMRSYGSKQIADIRDYPRHFPRTAALWLSGAVSITGAPIFALFLSEFIIMRGGFAQNFSWAVYAMAIFLIVIFVGFLNHFRVMFYEPAQGAEQPGPLSAWCVIPMALALVPLIVLGFWWPLPIWNFFAGIAAHLQAAAQ